MRSTAVWKQMWKQSLFTTAKLRTVNQRLNGQFILSDLQNFKDTTKTACSTKLPVLASNSASRLFSLRLDSTLRSQKT